MDPSSLCDDDLAAQAAAGDESALAELFDRHRHRLGQMVRLRLDPRLQGRIDASDVLQEAFLDLSRELPSYIRNPKFPPFLWMRLVAGQRLMRVHRQHLGTQMRDASREVSIHRSTALPDASSVCLARQLSGKLTSASKAAIRAEVQLQLQQALDSMEYIDREVIALRNFEELNNGEAAKVLGISVDAAKKRHVRALKRLQIVLHQFPGLVDS